MNDREIQEYCAILGVNPDIAPEELKRAYLKKSYTLIQGGAPEEERVLLRSAHAALTAYLEARAAAGDDAGANRPAAPGPVYTAPPVPAPICRPLDFDCPVVNAVAVPLVAALAILVSRSGLGFFLKGFHVWVHEFGHATVAWLTGKRALPLPIGWTNISPEKSNFVYFGLLALLGLLFAAGWKERKPWPMLFAAGLAVLQAYMTWLLPSETAREWIVFGGCGGQFYLSALMIGLFYFDFPEKFKWGGCRYVFLFIGVSCFYDAYSFWRKVKYGQVPLPYGSMVNGEEDANGDLDTLSADFGWSDRHIIATYTHLGDACLAVLVLVYLVFALRLNRLPGLIGQKPEDPDCAAGA
jgi:hypothetical protein